MCQVLYAGVDVLQRGTLKDAACPYRLAAVPGAFCMGDPGCQHCGEMPRRQFLACMVLDRYCRLLTGMVRAVEVPTCLQSRRMELCSVA